MSDWFSAHSHSAFSVLDGMSSVPAMVAKAAKDGRPALGITDHGNMAATVQLYKAAKQHGIMAFPGLEGYLIDPTFDGDLEDKGAGKLDRFHITLLALDYEGYKALTQFVSMTHTRPRFNRFPRALLTDLADLGTNSGDHIALLSGCFFGLAQQSLVRQGDDAAKRVLKMYAQWFPNTYVEVQNHNIAQQLEEDEAQNVITDSAVLEAMVDLADELGLPIMATQDSHYLDQKEKAAHALMKRMVYGGREDEFPGDSFHLASAEWVEEHFDADVWEMAEEGAADLLSKNELVIPALDTFKAHVPSTTRMPYEALVRRCTINLDVMSSSFSAVKQRTYKDRLKTELALIRKQDMAGYFMLMVKCVEWCQEHGIAIEARGSANGSLVCYLLGITQIDPIQWGTLFERFMSEDRIKPPDIDMDIEDDQRDRLIGFLGRNFDIMQIGTWQNLGVRSDDGKGSVMVTYQASLRRRAEAEYALAKVEEKEYGLANRWNDARHVFAARYGWIQNIDDVRKFNKDDYTGLMLLSSMSTSSKKDGVKRAYGVHPGGILVSSQKANLREVIPSMIVASSNTIVSQYDMDDIEEWGFLKYDWLGQATLRTMRICQELMGREDPTDFSWIPLDDVDACKVLREGRMETGIFHFEGYTKAKGGKELGIKSTKDAVLATALYLPGAMDSGEKDRYIARRRDTDLRRRVTYIHPVFETHLKDTYGTVIYQEQVIGIMRDLGMSMASINVFFKIVKDSGKGAEVRNAQRFATVRNEFDKCARANGIKDAQRAWDSFAGLVAYAFNKAHAAGYGLRSYRVAYLKAHYTLEFMTALLQTHAGSPKEKIYVREARHQKIRILPPDVNRSKMSWVMEKKRGAIRRGLVSIPGIGPATAEAIARNAPYADIEDLIDRNTGRTITGGKLWKEGGSFSGTLGKLKEAGALESLMSDDDEDAA